MVRTSAENLYNSIERLQAKRKNAGRLQQLVNTACRVRPMDPREKGMRVVQTKPVLRLLNEEDGVKCDFDNVFGTTDDNQAVFEDVGKPLCDEMIEGKDIALVAYGQTGSGKTYTLLGEPQLHGPPMGFISRCVDYLSENTDVSLGAAEVYGQNAVDIKAFDLNSESRATVTSLSGVTMVSVDDARDAQQFLLQAKRKLHLEPTATSPQSSRGHAVYILEASGARFTIIDLAGSSPETAFTDEYQSVTDSNVVELRKTETVAINEGLRGIVQVIKHISEHGEIKKGQLFGANTEAVRFILPVLEECKHLFMMYFFSPTENDAKSSQNTIRVANHVVKMSLQREAEVRRVMLDVAKAKLHELEKENNGLQVTIDRLEEKIHRSENAGADLKMQLDQATIKLNKQQIDIHHLKNKQEAIEAQTKELEEQNKYATRKGSELSVMHDEDIMKIQDLEVELERAVKDFGKMKKSLNAKIKEEDAEIKKLEAANKIIEDENMNLKVENKKLKGLCCAPFCYSAPAKLKKKLAEI